MSQLERIIQAARAYNGTCQADWLCEVTPDEGPRITRVAARIRDARDLGYEFEQLHDRNGTRVYRLVSRPEAERSAGDDQHDGKSEASRKGTAVLTAGRPSDASASLSPEPLFKVGKAELGYADQGELDAA